LQTSTVQASPVSQVTSSPKQNVAVHVSFVVQAPRPSVHGSPCLSGSGKQKPCAVQVPSHPAMPHVPPACGVPWHVPLTQVSFTVQGLPSLQLPPTGVPVQLPPEHMSGLVHSLPSLQDWACAGVDVSAIATTAAQRSCRIHVSIERPPCRPSGKMRANTHKMAERSISFDR
jgi:hypothetical protein